MPLPEHRPGVRDLLRYRDFTRYAASRFLATIAWQMLGVAIGWQVYAITRDPLDLGLIGLAQFLPFLTLLRIDAKLNPAIMVPLAIWAWLIGTEWQLFS